ncbi:hypothetical protein Tco_0319772 [Tanacetum coccineum]
MYDLFRIGDENLKRMENDIDQDSSCEQDDDSEDDQEEDGDDRDTFDMSDITVEDIERIRQFLTPNVPEVIEDVIQPLIPKTLHTTPPNEDYVTPATKSILDELLEKFGDEILNVTMVDEGSDFNPDKDIEELEKLLANDPKPHYMEIQVNSVIINPKPFIHTQPMNPLYKIFESYNSSTTPYKVDREMKSPFRHFKFELVRYHAKDDDGIFVIMDVARRSRLGAWLRACCLFIIPSKSRGVFRSNSTLIS